jgi:hypothetical protein
VRKTKINLKLSLLHLILFISGVIGAQVREGFTVDIFDNKSNWYGDLNHFEFADSTLKLNQTNGGTSIIYCNSTSFENAIWDFDFTIDFNPSSYNYARFLLASNDTIGIENSLIVDFGKSNDQIKLMIFDQGIEKIIFQSKEKILDNDQNRVKLKLTKLSGEYTIDIQINDSIKTKDSIGFEDIAIDCKYFGIFLKYTKTRADKFYFKKIQIEDIFIPDTLKPHLSSVKIKDSNNINLIFSEKSILNISSIVSPTEVESIKTTDSIRYNLKLSKPLNSGEYFSVNLNEFWDLSENSNSALVDSLLFYQAKNYDLRINEINYLSDSERKDSYEFIEIYNSSSGIIPLDSLNILIDTRLYQLPNKALKPGAYFCIFNEQIDIGIENYSNSAIVEFPYLKNSGSKIALESNDGSVIVDKIDYSYLLKYKSPIDQNRLWSLELKDPSDTCNFFSNWEFCNSFTGNTVNRINSAHKSSNDDMQTGILNIQDTYLNLDNDKLFMVFSQNADFQKASVESDISFDAVFSHDYLNRLVLELTFLEGITQKSFFLVKDVVQCDGSMFKSDSIFVDVIDVPEESDIIFNEILFDPDSGGSKFVEIFNNSDLVYDLRNLFIANFHFDGDNTSFENKIRISEKSRLIFPGQYYCITKDSSKVKRRYKSGKIRFFAEVEKMPKINSDQGKITLLYNEDQVIDILEYSSEQHFKLLNDQSMQGVSLERISPTALSLNKSNWTSSSELSSGATPALDNSQRMRLQGDMDEIEIINRVFNPLSSRYKNYTSIAFNLNSNETVASIKIYDLKGNIINTLINNAVIGNKDTVIWNGKDSYNQAVAEGLYIISVELNNSTEIISKKNFTCRVFY